MQQASPLLIEKKKLLKSPLEILQIDAISGVQVQTATDWKEKCAVRANLPLNNAPDKRISALHTRNDVSENGERKMPAMFRQI